MLESTKHFNFHLCNEIQHLFYPNILKYLDFILKPLIKGKHTSKNELEGMGSQYIHLYYKEDKKLTKKEDGVSSFFVVARNEQHGDVIFKVYKDKYIHSVSVFLANESLEDKVKYGSFKVGKNKEIIFDSEEKLRQHVSSNRNVFFNQTTKDILNNKGKELFSVRKLSFKGQEPSLQISSYSPSKELFFLELEVFDLINCLICGICNHNETDWPKDFYSDLTKESNFIKKLTKHFITK